MRDHQQLVHENTKAFKSEHLFPGWVGVTPELCIPDQPNNSFQPYAAFIEDMNSHTEGRCSGLFWKEAMKYDSHH
jgi:hypothetical protein